MYFPANFRSFPHDSEQKNPSMNNPIFEKFIDITRNRNKNKSKSKSKPRTKSKPSMVAKVCKLRQIVQQTHSFVEWISWRTFCCAGQGARISKIPIVDETIAKVGGKFMGCKAQYCK